jgi:hemerythrin
MEWKSEYSIGIPEIDEEHKVLLGCIARLDAAKDSRQRDIDVYFVLTELRYYTRVHFAVEEIIMRVFGYPGREAHVQAHRRFTKYIKSMQQSVLQRDAREELVAFLRTWLVNHIMVTDRQYAVFMLGQEGAGSPA